MSLSDRKVVAITVPAGCLMFVIGLLIGHYAIEKMSTEGDDLGPNPDKLIDTTCTGTYYEEEFLEYKNNYLKQCVADTCRQGDCDTEGLPRTYIAYHLNGDTINIDGKLDDPAWKNVPWSESFVDMSGSSTPPRFDTKIKIRWDDDKLYVGAYMQETDFWGTINTDEDMVSMENAFEMFVVPDGSMHNYKEHQINVFGATRDLMMNKAYMDKKWYDWENANTVDYRCTNISVENSSWSGIIEKATYTDSTINDPNAPKGTYWTTEWSFSFANLAEHTLRTTATPDAEEVWFFNFARPEYDFTFNKTWHYQRSSSTPEFSSWQPVNSAWTPHIPSRFGLVQFKKNMRDTKFHFDRWHIYRALFALFEAQHKFYAVNDMFTIDWTLLDLPPKLLSPDCVRIEGGLAHHQNIFNRNLNVYETFSMRVKSQVDPSLPEGHIRTDRKVRFW